jgi:RNA polymerase sigma-70 factor (ECF subfamily)
MPEQNNTAIVQRYLDELTGEIPPQPVVRPLLDRAFLRLQRLCATLLYRDYPRLTHPPLNLQTDELLSAVVERLPRIAGWHDKSSTGRVLALRNWTIRFTPRR